MWCSRSFFSRLLEESVECLGVVNLDSTVRSTKQALHSFQAGQSRVPVPSPSPRSQPQYFGREEEGNYTLTSTSSLSTRHAKLSANPTQPSPAYPSPPLVVRRLQRQQAAPTQRGVLGSTDSTPVPPGAGRKGSAPKKRLIRKLGFLGASTGLYCTVLLCSLPFCPVMSRGLACASNRSLVLLWPLVATIRRPSSAIQYLQYI
jgi:hypothetical protein